MSTDDIHPASWSRAQYEVTDRLGDGRSAMATGADGTDRGTRERNGFVTLCGSIRDSLRADGDCDRIGRKGREGSTVRVFSGGLMGSRRGLLCVAAISLSLATTAACGDGGSATPAANGHSISPSVDPATVTISPDDHTHHARPDHPIVVRASNGKLLSVKVHSKDGRDVTGTFNESKTVWKSTWTLSPSAHYRVKAIAANPDNRQTKRVSTFTTLEPESGFHAFVTGTVSDGSTVGVGFPLIVNFSQPIANKEWVEEGLQVKMSKPVEGAWNWLSDTRVVFRPKHLWPKHEKIHLIAHMDGVRGAKGMYGYQNLSMHYKVGHRVIVKTSAKTHQLKVYKDGKLVNHWPVSMGRGGQYKYYTTSGIHLTMNKGNPVWMTSPGNE